MQETLTRATRSWTIREAKKRACNSSRACILSFARTCSLAAFCSCKHRKRTLLLALYDSLKTISRGTSSPSNPYTARLPVYNLRKSAMLKLTIIFVPSRRGEVPRGYPKFERVSFHDGANLVERLSLRRRLSAPKYHYFTKCLACRSQKT